MKQRGFTLLELLGILMVLGLIIIITYPIVSSIIVRTRKKAVTDSIYNYIRTVESAIAKDATDNPLETHTGTYEIQGKKIVSKDGLDSLLIPAKGTYPTGTLVIEKRVVKKATLKLDRFAFVYDGKKVKVK